MGKLGTNAFLKKFFIGPRSILLVPLVPLFRTLKGFAESQGRFIITHALSFVTCTQCHLWLPGLGIEPGSLALEAGTIPLRQPCPANGCHALYAKHYGFLVFYQITVLTNNLLEVFEIHREEYDGDAVIFIYELSVRQNALISSTLL